MKSEKGVTLSSLIIYVIAMVIVVSIIAVMTKYFYGNVNKLSNTSCMVCLIIQVMLMLR